MGHVSLRALDHDIEQATELRDQIAALVADVHIARDHARRLIANWSPTKAIADELNTFADSLDDVIHDHIEGGALALADKRLLEAESTHACHAYTATERLAGCV